MKSLVKSKLLDYWSGVVLPESVRSSGLELANRVHERLSEAASDKIGLALGFAAKAHEGQKRKSGEPYLIHPVEVAVLADRLRLDEDAICAALLHDVVEDCGVSLETIAEEFGAGVAGLVDALTKIGGIHLDPDGSKKTQSAQNLRKMILAMGKDLRAILVKVCDRLHNMRTLGSLRRDKALRIARETQEIYAPIAGRLGLGWVRDELLELCFKTEHPWRERILREALEERSERHKNYVEKAAVRLMEKLESEEVEAVVTGRSKTLHSAYLKMKEKGLRLSEVLDKEGFRILVDEKKDCYVAIGAVHDLWKPIPGTFKDYIALPKLNGYQSLHTAVLNENGHAMEIQVRTFEMHRVSEMGVAAHWVYKDRAEDSVGPEEPWLWLQSLLDIQSRSGLSEDFVDNLKTDLFSDEVYVFTPAGEVVALPQGASALDFAFAIHSDVGLRACGARVNGEAKDIGTRLRSGDRVSVETSESVRPQVLWLAMVKTGRAKAHIRAYLRGVENEKAGLVGKTLLLSALADLGMNASAADDPNGWNKVKKSLGVEKAEAILRCARGSMAALGLARLLCQGSLGKGVQAQRRPIQVSGEEGEFVKMAKCCLPLPPGKIVGTLGPSDGLMIHSEDCPKIKGLADLVDAAWEPEALNRSHSALIEVKCKNARGLLAQLAAAVSGLGADIENVRLNNGSSGAHERVEVDFEVKVKSKFHLDRVCEKIRQLPGVVSANS